MKLLLLGATGRTGALVLENALAKGHEVVALVRDPAKVTINTPALTLIAGSPERPEDVNAAIVGCEAVLVALNNSRASDSPWAKPVSPPRLMETSVRNTVAAMKANGIRRIVILSALGVGDSFAEAPWLTRIMISKTNLGISSADHDRVDAYIRTTDTDWTLARLAALSNTKKSKKLVISYNNVPKPAMFVSRRQVANFLVDSLNDQSFYKKAPVVSER